MMLVATMSLNTSAGATYTYGASNAASWQRVESATKYWLSKNGSKVQCEQRNFQLVQVVNMRI